MKKEELRRLGKASLEARLRELERDIKVYERSNGYHWIPPLKEEVETIQALLRAYPGGASAGRFA